MKLAVLNFSGNVGKSTLTKHLFAPRIPNSKIIAVETINENGSNDEKIKGKNFKDVLIELAILDSVIVDIGSSNIEQVFNQLKTLADAHEDFDYYVVPTVPSGKQQIDTMKLLFELISLGIETSKIRIIFNQVETDETVEKAFPKLYQFCKENNISTKAVVYNTDLFSMLKDTEIADAVNDSDSIKKKLAESEDMDEKRKYANLLTVSRLAKGVQKNLDETFKVMFNE